MIAPETRVPLGLPFYSLAAADKGGTRRRAWRPGLVLTPGHFPVTDVFRESASSL